MARWCDGGRTQRSRLGSLTDKAVKSSKRRAAEAPLDKVVIGSDPPLENVPHFQYLGSRLQGDGSDEADVGHRLEIAQSAFKGGFILLTQSSAAYAATFCDSSRH